MVEKVNSVYDKNLSVVRECCCKLQKGSCYLFLIMLDRAL